MRLFVSVDLPPDLAEPVAALQDGIADAPGLRLTDPGQAHLTLKFLGEVDPDDVEAIQEVISGAVAAADVDPFEATFAGVGAFPSDEYIRVVWLGVEDGADALVAIHEAVETALVDIGFDPESHAFTPHVTLARMDHAGGKAQVQRFLAADHHPVGTMRVEDVRLTESELGPDGPVYSTVARFPL